ncbi:MAG: AAA family ATPase, partial [Cyanobacteriota bacterium]|nr:AAA family ATPase [Cyanobacteriota bacterium]
MKNTSTLEYTLDKIINTGVSTNIYRSVKEGNIAVIRKVLKDDYPTIEAIARLKHEYSIAANLEHENIVKILELENSAEHYAIVFEDFGGISLRQYLESNRPSLETILQVAIAITQALVYIHSKQIIHKDIKPANIIVKNLSENNNVSSIYKPVIKITDFSIGSWLEKEMTQQTNCNQLEGTLAYISPEQTGRMNRSLDFRSDFYSLGVTLYEMLTGQLPFASDDPLELIHAHIAEQPTSINQLNPNINATFCAIVEKLMAKNAEDRYQSAEGLLADLQQCWEQFQATGTIQNFTPGRLEVISQLLIPQKLYGRESDVQLLLNSFERMTQGNSELILVSGYSGIGKTSVINEVNKPITKAGGYFISGKSDQFKRDIPYASLIQAFSSLCRELLTESSSQLKRWQDKIQKAVGNNGQVLIDLIPEVELIIGKQVEAPQIEPIEAQNRLNQVFQKFVSLFTIKEHPLVIFIDDLQWADASTLKLMQLLATDFNIEYLLIIGAYRDNEVNPTHPLISTVEEIEKHKNINHINLKPLSNHNVTELVAETLNDNKQDSSSLAKLIFNKTAGNPFFVTQLLQSLYQESLLKFDFSQQKWLWDIQEIQSIGITDKSVVDLVASRIEKLPETTQQVLKLAACIGDKFTLDVLSVVNEQSINKTANCLNKALEAGLILPLNQNYRIPLLFDDSEKISSFENNKVSYKFLHDRV